MTDYYTVKIICRNCGATDTVEIPKGQTIEAYLAFHKCHNCGCSETISNPDFRYCC